MNQPQYDVAVVGGGAAGLSAALVLSRARRKVLVVDAGQPRNAPATHVHGYLSRDGFPPGQLLTCGRKEVTRYGGVAVEGSVTELVPHGRTSFWVLLANGQRISARRVLVTTGLRDELPDVPGLADRWGRDVLHCPYCHGGEVRDRRIGVLATGATALHRALLFRQLSAQVTVVLDAGATLTDEEREQLDARSVAVVDGPAARVEAGPEGIRGVRLASGGLVALDALVVAPRTVARAGLLAPLGLEPVEVRVGGQVIGTRVEADETGATAVPGVWVAGNVADLRAMVVVSAAAGLAAAVAINSDLVAEDTRRAVGSLHRV